MKTKLVFSILISVCIALFCCCVILGILFYQCQEKGKVLTKLPLPSLEVPTKERGLGGAEEEAKALTYPYYYPYPYKLISYSYKLTGQFPELPSSLMVYKATPETFDLAKAKALAAMFGFKEEPKVEEDIFIFTEGKTPSVLYREETKVEPAPEVSEAEPGAEPSVPPTEEEDTGRELTISKDGSISYVDYSVSRKEVVWEEGKEEVKPLPPEGVETKEKAQEIAVNFLKDIRLLPESYQVEIFEPYGSWGVNIYPKFNGYTMQTAGIYLEIGNQGKVANLFLRKIKFEDFNEYPIKTKDEALKVETVEYQIEKVEVSYRSAFDEKGNEYLEPFYILSGKDSQGQEFSFEIPAVKAEFLEEGGVVPLKTE